MKTVTVYNSSNPDRKVVFPHGTRHLIPQFVRHNLGKSVLTYVREELFINKGNACTLKSRQTIYSSDGVKYQRNALETGPRGCRWRKYMLRTDY